MPNSNLQKYPHHQQHPHRRREPPPRHRSWCCSTVPHSPENPKQKPINSVPISPKPSLKNRILSPGRVSPVVDPIVQEPLPRSLEVKIPAEPESGSSSLKEKEEENGVGIFDVRLSLKGRNGGSLVLELNSEVLVANSSVFKDLIASYRSGDSAASFVRIEVPEVENLSVFQMTIELMFVDDVLKRLMKIGVYRAIDVLEVSAGIAYNKGVSLCLKYLEAVPWNEDEEDKLRALFSKLKFHDATSKDILARLYAVDSVDSQQTLARKLVWSITACNDANARNELKSLVKSLLCKSSIYEKDYPDISKEDIYVVCQSCIDELVNLFEEASGSPQTQTTNLANKEMGKTLIERISRQVDNINWLLEILLDWQMAEEFVNMWSNQVELLSMHEMTSPMVRYELSRVSALLFVVMGTRKLQCGSEARIRLLQAWFGPMLLDFGWLQRCKKGLDLKVLEEAVGHVLLTLPLKHQYPLFMEWFQYFSKHGTECPNISKAFQIWWRRSFLRGSESNAIESR